MCGDLILGGPPLQAKQVQLLEEHFLSLLNWHLSSLDPLHFIKLLLHSWCNPYLGYSICSYNSSNLDSFSNGDQSDGQILHHDCYSLAPCSHLSKGIYDAQLVRQVGTISLLQGLHHHIHVASQEHGLSLGMYDLWRKSVDFLLFCHLGSLIQVSQVPGVVHIYLTLNGVLCLVTRQQVGYSQPIQWNGQLIYLTLCNHVYDSVDSQCAQNDWHFGAKVSWIWNDQGHLVFIVAPLPFHLNPYDDIA